MRPVSQRLRLCPKRPLCERNLERSMLISWYRQKVTDFGLWRGTWLLWQVVWGRVRVIASNALLPDKLECPCCSWKGHRFFDYVEAGYTVRNASCPQCDSHPRHRTFFLWLR